MRTFSFTAPCAAAILAAVFLLPAGCVFFQAPLPRSGIVELAVDMHSRTITPSDGDSFTVAWYVVKGAGMETGNATAQFESERMTAASFRKDGLLSGAWRFTVEGYNAGGHMISSAGFDLTVVADAAVSKAVNLIRLKADGTIDVTVTWAASDGFDEAAAVLTPENGVPEPERGLQNLTPASARYLAVRPAGRYSLDVRLKSGGTVVRTVSDSVEVYGGYTSEAVVTVSKEAPLETDGTVEPVAGPVARLVFDGKPAKTFSVNASGGKSVFLVKANVSGKSVPPSSSGRVGSAYAATPYDRSVLQPESQSPSDDGRIVRLEHLRAAAFNANPPPFARDGISGRSAETSKPVVPYGNPASFLVVGSYSRKFFVERTEVSGPWIELPATLRAAGRYCYVWVADENFSDSSVTNSDDKVTTAQAEALRDKFDGTAANGYADGIFRNVTGLFGYEYGGGDGGNGGRDRDQHISILVYDIGDDSSPAQTSGILGYFWSKDHYSQTELIGEYGTSAPKTNYAEIFYVDSSFTDAKPELAASTLVHEYQHMIGFNTAVVSLGLSNPVWYDEMLSLVAEDLVSYGINLNPAKTGPIGRFGVFNRHYAESGVTDWLNNASNPSDPVILKSYAGVFAFGAYLARNYGGADLFRRMARSGKVGTAAVGAALAAAGYSGPTFDGVFRRFGEALVFGDQPSGAAVNSFKKTSEVTLDGLKYTALPIDAASIQQRSVAAGFLPGAYGPRLYAPSEQVELRAYGLSVHSKPSWTNLSGSVEITLSAPADPSVELYIMVR